MGMISIFKKDGRPLLRKPRSYVAFGFWLPFLAVSLALLVRAFMFTRNGDNRFSLLYSDSYYQYFPFFKAFRADILAGNSLLYTFNTGMGMDYLGIIAYYLGSPLNLLSILVPESLLIEYFTFLQPVRIGLAGLFFSIMLKKLFEKDEPALPLFAALYATCAWTFGYMWNSMWMDTFALLPLVVLGTYQLLKTRKFLLYTLSLFLSVAINYYIGLFTCIFTLLVFICYQVCNARSFRRFWADLGLMALFTCIALGMTCFISIPTLASLMTTSSSANHFPTTFQLNIATEQTFLGLLDAMRQVATNTFALVQPNHMESEALPNIYCGVSALIFSLLYVTSRQIPLRERLCAIFMLLFLNISFLIRQLDYIWHGFHFPNMIPYRFSFLYSFVMVYMAFKAWLLRRRIRPWQVILAAVAALAMLLTSAEFADSLEYMVDPMFTESLMILLRNWHFSVQDFKELLDLLGTDVLFIIVNVGLLALYLVPMAVLSAHRSLRRLANRSDKQQWYKKLPRRRNVCSIILTLVIAAELMLNIGYFALTVPCNNVYNYPPNKEALTELIDYADENDPELFYRSAMDQVYLINDGAYLDYNGISTFSSSANAAVTKLMRRLGIRAHENWNSISYRENSPVTDMFLNIKYQFKDKEKNIENPFYEDVYSAGDVVLQKNSYYLPLGFMVDPGLAELNIDEAGNPYQFQTQFLSAALGSDVTLWSMIAEENLAAECSDGVTLSEMDENQLYDYTVGNSVGTITFTFTADKAGYIALYPGWSTTGEFTVYYDNGSGFTQLYKEKYNIPNLYGIALAKPGDRVQVTFECSQDTEGKIRCIAGILDVSAVQRAYQQLSESTLTVTSFDETGIESTISCSTAGLMYTSVPQNNENWQVYVDGAPAEITLVADAMIGVMLEEGEHTIIFVYKNKAFTVGCVVSAVFLLLLVMIWWVVYRFPVKFPEKHRAILDARAAKKAARAAKKEVPAKTETEEE